MPFFEQRDDDVVLNIAPWPTSHDVQQDSMARGLLGRVFADSEEDEPPVIADSEEDEPPVIADSEEDEPPVIAATSPLEPDEVTVWLPEGLAPVREGFDPWLLDPDHPILTLWEDA